MDKTRCHEVATACLAMSWLPVIVGAGHFESGSSARQIRTWRTARVILGVQRCEPRLDLRTGKQHRLVMIRSGSIRTRGVGDFGESEVEECVSGGVQECKNATLQV